MDTDSFFISDTPSENTLVLKTKEEVEQFIKDKLSANEITSIFNNYIIKHNIIGIDNIDNNSFWKNMGFTY